MKKQSSLVRYLEDSMPNNAMLRGQPGNAGQFRGAIRSETNVDTFADDLDRHLARCDGDDRAQRAGVDRDDLARAMGKGGDDETIMMTAIKFATARNGEAYADLVLAENEVFDLARRFGVMDDEDDVADALKDNFRDHVANNRPLAFPEHRPMMDDAYLGIIDDVEDGARAGDGWTTSTVACMDASMARHLLVEENHGAMDRAGVTDDDIARAIEDNQAYLDAVGRRARQSATDAAALVCGQAMETVRRRNAVLYANSVLDQVGPETIQTGLGAKSSDPGDLYEALREDFDLHVDGEAGLTFEDHSPSSLAVCDARVRKNLEFIRNDPELSRWGITGDEVSLSSCDGLTDEEVRDRAYLMARSRAGETYANNVLRSHPDHYMMEESEMVLVYDQARDDFVEHVTYGAALPRPDLSPIKED